MTNTHQRVLATLATSGALLFGSIGIASIAAAATGGPTVTLTSTSPSVTSSTTIPIAATFSEAVTGFATSSVNVSNATVDNFVGSSSSYTFDIHPTTAGTVTVAVPADVAMNASSTGNQASNTLTFTFSSSTATSTATTSLALISTEAMQSTATADGTFENGFKWVLTFTVPENETNFQMRFTDFTSGSGTIAAANNIRISSAQSSNASTTSSAIVSTNNEYGTALTLTGDSSASTAGRQVQVTVEVRVPFGTPAGSGYTTTFGARSSVTTP